MTVPITDFGNSYVYWFLPANPNDKRVPGHKPWGNGARIQFDALCTITDEKSGESAFFYLIVPCRNEWMYQEVEMIQQPGGEYRCIYSRDRQLVLGYSAVEPSVRPKSSPMGSFTTLEYTVQAYADVTPLTTDAAIIAATDAKLAINALTEFRNEATGLRAVVEYPVRTMNIIPERQRFQVDTGPLIFPDLAADEEHLIDRCKLAHAVYNTFDYGQFVCKQTTPILHDGQPVAYVFDYTDFRSLSVQHSFYAAGRL